MKKLGIIFLFLFFLVSCNKREYDVKYEITNESKIFAYNIETQKIEEAYTYFKIEEVEDVFLLYTKYQNYLPCGYSSMGSANVSLLKTEIKEEVVYYEVDNYISLLEDKDIFLSLLIQTNQDLGYKNTIIIYNGKSLV